MSEHISIQEGGKSRNFGNVELLETETTDGTGSCFWVPENARELENDYFIENGDYTPEKYAYSDVTVRVMEPFDDLEIGFVPDPEIPDIPIPHIEEIPDPIPPVPPVPPIPPIDLTIDPDTGLPKVKIDGVDIDLPDISADIDINGDLDISLDLENNELDISGLNMDGLDVNLSIDLGTLDIDVTDLPDEIRIMHVPTKTAYKDGEEIDLDGLVVQAYRGGEVWNDASGKYIDGYVPAHELTVNKANVPSSSKVSSADIQWTTDKISLTSYEYYEQFHLDQIRKYDWNSIFAWRSRPNGKMRLCFYQYDDLNRGTNDRIHVIAAVKIEDAAEFEEQIMPTNKWFIEHFILDKPIGGQYKENAYYLSSPHAIGMKSGHFVHGGWVEEGDPGVFVFHGVYDAQVGKGYDADFPINKDMFEILDRNIIAPNGDAVYFTYYIGYLMHYDMDGNKKNKVNISWSRPKDNKLLTASLNISVEESEGGVDSSGTHYSGRFDESSSGHWGGTTPSGEYGGSHHSGKF